MVRAIDSSLRNTLNAKTFLPAVQLVVEDRVIHYASYQTPGMADAWNDACIAADNGIVRVQVTRGGTGYAENFQVQRVTDPTQATQWATWTTLPGSGGLMSQDGGCAVSCSGGVLRAFAQRGTGGSDLWCWTSTDGGVTWSGPVTVLVPPGNAQLKGVSSAGNNDVFFLYDVSGGEAIGYSHYANGNWAPLTTWTLGTISDGAGLAVAWTGSIYVVIYSDGYTLYSCTFNPTGNTWSSNTEVVPSSSTFIGHVAPRLCLADGLYALTSIEFDTGQTTGTIYNYPRLRQSSDLLHWSNGLIVPDMSSLYGVVPFKLVVPQSGSAGARYYLVSPGSIYSAPAFQGSSTQQLDVSASILSYQRLEEANKPARLEVVLDNARGVYNTLVTVPGWYQPIGLNASLILSEGYKVGTPPLSDVVQVGTYHITQIQFVRAPDQNQLRLIALDVSRNLDLVSRYQFTYSGQTLGFLVTEICAKAGLFSVQLPTTTQMSQIVPSFVLQAGQSYRHALNELCNTYGLVYFCDQNEVMRFCELSAGDASVWTYQPEIEAVIFGSNDQHANHVIVMGKPPVGSGSSALTVAESSDAMHLHLIGLEQLRYHVDQKLTTSSQCSQKATFLLAQELRAQVQHSVTVPLNPALQLYDVITLTDSAAPAGSGQNGTCRIVHMLAQFDAQQAEMQLHLGLEGV
jgi:hypothetical protein